MIDNVNPYASPRNAVESAAIRRHVSATTVFIVAAEIAFLSLLFAPAQPHPEPYTATEQLLVTLTSSWAIVAAFVLTVAASATIAFLALRRLGSWFAGLPTRSVDA